MFINLVDYKVTGSISLNVIHDVSILWNVPEIYQDKETLYGFQGTNDLLSRYSAFSGL